MEDTSTPRDGRVSRPPAPASTLEAVGRGPERRIDWLSHAVQFFSVLFGVLLAFQLAEWSERGRQAERSELLLTRAAAENRDNLAALVDDSNERYRQTKHAYQTLAALSRVRQMPDDSLFALAMPLANVGSQHYSTRHQSTAVVAELPPRYDSLASTMLDLLRGYDELGELDELGVTYGIERVMPTLYASMDFMNQRMLDRAPLEKPSFQNEIIIRANILRAQTLLLDLAVEEGRRLDSLAVIEGVLPAQPALERRVAAWRDAIASGERGE